MSLISRNVEPVDALTTLLGFGMGVLWSLPHDYQTFRSDFIYYSTRSTIYAMGCDAFIFGLTKLVPIDAKIIVPVLLSVGICKEIHRRFSHEPNP